MKLSAKGIALLKQLEGCSLIAYRDSKGVWTIGYGHTGRDFGPGSRWSQREADDMLVADVAWAEAAVNNLVKSIINQNQFDALVIFTFNVGAANLKLSTLLKKVNGSDWVGAQAQFRRWNKVTMPNGLMKVDVGLVNRRRAECELFNSKELP